MISRMALGNAEVIIAYADRIGTSPALPSRLLQRLDAFIGEGRCEGAARQRGAALAASRPRRSTARGR